MLVLSRKPGESIRIGDNITITVIRICPGVCRLGITAPREMSVMREELGPYTKPVATHDEGGEG